jgi:hypothetical protein
LSIPDVRESTSIAVMETVKETLSIKVVGWSINGADRIVNGEIINEKNTLPQFGAINSIMHNYGALFAILKLLHVHRDKD